MSNEKDIVAAELNLGTSKITPAFKVIDEGAKQNAANFKLLNAEILITEKSYVSMAKSMDKLALSADERKKKIMDESNALVAQRRAQAELLTAKKNQMDITNQVVASKLQAQQAIQKKHQDAVLQQAKQHQQRLATLQANTVVAASHDNLVQAKLDKEFVLTKSHYAKMQQQAEMHKAKMSRMSEFTDMNNTLSNFDKFSNQVKRAAVHATVFHAIYSSIHLVQDVLRTGLVDIEANMAGYVQTNSKYFVSFEQGTNKMIMNTQKLSEETTKFIHTTHELGSDILDVTESARLWGRMYKDVGVVQEMVRQSTLLSVIDLVELEKATKITESTIAQYAVQIRNVNDAQVHGNRILDSWSKVAHDTMAPARDLGAAFERTGKIANETGVSFDFMNGLVSSGIRNTALSGENLGNMWKTVLGTIRTDKAVNELESLGVATKNIVNGIEEWRKAEDILLDLSIAVVDKNYDLTQSYADISRGIFQFAKLAASLNVGDILLGQSASINSEGSTLEYLEVQMDTIQRKAAQTKASLLEIFNQAGDDGLRKMIKGALDILDQLLIGITKVPKEVFTATASIAGLIAVYKLVVVPLIAWRSAEVALTAAITAQAAASSTATLAMIGQTAAAANAARMTVLATAGISLIVGAIAVYLMSLGAAEKAERKSADKRDREIASMQQQYGEYERQAEFLPKLVGAHNALQKQLDSGKLSVDQQTLAKESLEKISKALRQTIDEEGIAQLRAAGYTDDATNEIIISINKRKDALNTSIAANLNLEASENSTALSAAQKKLKEANQISDNPSVLDWINPWVDVMHHDERKKKAIDKAASEVKDIEKAALDIEQKRIDIAATMAEKILAGVDGKRIKAETDKDELKKTFQEEFGRIHHLINMKEKGYLTAVDQANHLKSVRDKYKSSLDEVDLWGINEEIVRTTDGIANKPKGYGSGKNNAFNLPLNDIDIQVKNAQSMIDSATSLIEFYNARKSAFGTAVNDSAQQVELYTNRQNKLKESNGILNGSLSALGNRQSSINSLYKSGKITLDEYNKATEDITTRKASLTKEISNNSIAWINDAKAIKEAKEQVLKDSFDFSSEWIAHQKAIGEMSTQREYDILVDMQGRYLKGTKEATVESARIRTELDEEVFAAKKNLMQEEENKLDKLVKKQTDQLQKSKKAELDAIEESRKAYVDGVDEKIRAIDKLMATEDDANEDTDYNKEIAEKKARVAVLQSAVGPEAIKERNDLLKEIEKMEIDRGRVLSKRKHELDKQTYEEEKRVKEEGYEKEKKEVETHYENLLSSFDGFKNDLEGRAELLKNVQISKESEKNATILANLNTFSKDYKSTMDSITSLSRAQAEIDFEKYTANGRLWKTGSIEEKARAHTENVGFRKKYNIPENNYVGLQHFAEGGRVKGRGAVPIVAHGGEMIFNERQQDNLFKLLNFSMPKMNFSMPSMDFKSSQPINNYYNFDNSMGNVAVNGTNGVAGLYDQRGGLISRQQSQGGRVR